jgi:transcriptional regulator with XRE-family HTH domain
MKDTIQRQLKRYGGNLRRIRSQQAMTQEKLAELADLNIRTVQKIEAGQTNILITTAARIAKALDADHNELMDF